VNLGNLFSTLICYGSTKAYPDIDDERSWRIPLYAMIAIPVVILIAELIFLVESPYWLAMCDRMDQARKSIRFLYPYMTEDEIDIEVAKVRYTLEKEAEVAVIVSTHCFPHMSAQSCQNKRSSYLDCFKGFNLRRTFGATFPAFCQPLILCGPYSTYFFALSGESNSLEAAAIVQSTGFFSNFCLYFIIDNKRIGLWNILFWGCVTMTLSMCTSRNRKVKSCC
jgi:hypothetical protein